MHRKAIKFRDVWVAPGSECFAALEAGDHTKAAQIYNECEAQYKKHAYELLICADCFAVNPHDAQRCHACGSEDLQ